jgi:hypothetical protein
MKGPIDAESETAEVEAQPQAPETESHDVVAAR